ncbi:hypothetical protein Tco_1002424 [Tanacetum coccineum]|uniref:RNA-directed DNA polymerase, eukaryota n=1 Tax=Tanacetum coccineum TaxID=301880 RepID=A0ABQ5F692_9ASTR
MTKLLSSSTCSRVVDTLERRKRTRVASTRDCENESRKLKEKNSDRVRIPPMKRKKIKQVCHGETMERGTLKIPRLSDPRLEMIDYRTEFETKVGTNNFQTLHQCVGESQQRAVGSSYGTLAREISIEAVVKLMSSETRLEVLHRVCRWWEIDFQLWRSFSEWDEWFSSIRLPGSVKGFLEGVFYVAWWFIWGFRNRSTFDVNKPSRSILFENIQNFSNLSNYIFHVVGPFEGAFLSDILG